jgi:hypothetical protein
VSYIAAACLIIVLGVMWLGSSGASAGSSSSGTAHACDPGQCFAKCPFTCQIDRLSDQLCQSLDRLSDHFAKH